jgi:hypothetical protein
LHVNGPRLRQVIETVRYSGADTVIERHRRLTGLAGRNGSEREKTSNRDAENKQFHNPSTGFLTLGQRGSTELL